MSYPKDSLAGAKATPTNTKAGVMPVLVLCDNSGSMKDYVDRVNQCLRGLIEELQRSPVLSHKIDLSIVSFNTKCTELLPFTMVDRIDPARLGQVQPEDWATYLGTALSYAVDQLAREKQQFKDAKADYVQPNLIVLSDGHPEHEEKSVTDAGIRAVQEKMTREHWNCIPILIGHDYDPDKVRLEEISVPDESGRRTVIKFASSNKAEDIVAAFQFASMSVSAVADQHGYDPMSTIELQKKIEKRKRIMKQNGKDLAEKKKQTFRGMLGF